MLRHATFKDAFAQPMSSPSAATWRTVVATSVVTFSSCEGSPVATTLLFPATTMLIRKVYSVSGCRRCGTVTGRLAFCRADCASGESKLRSPQSGLGNHSMK